jgi:predicted enzyme related to lactoylglutathione lyase
MYKAGGFEIPVNNLKRAGKFYETAFGWKVNAHKGNYYHIETVKMDKNWVPWVKGAVNGGMFKRESKNEHMMLVIDVPSIEEALQGVKKAKGKIITAKTPAGDWGWWAQVKDTEKNVFELWEDNKASKPK